MNYVSANDVIVNLVCPGLVKGTGLQREWPKLVLCLAKTVTSIPARSPEVGASTYVDAVVLTGKESHGSFLMSWKVAPYVSNLSVRIERGVADSCLCRFVSLLYTPEGKQVAEKLWSETLNELRFTNVEGILASMEKK